jgi:hypothetical protein
MSTSPSLTVLTNYTVHGAMNGEALQTTQEGVDVELEKMDIR